MVFLKKLTFLQLLFLCKMDREKVIGEGLERKRFKRAPKFAFFQMGLVHGFCKKWKFLHGLFLCKMDREKVFLWSSREKMKTFLTIKTLTSKSRKICIFPKGLIHGFCQKLRFSRLFFVENGSRKCVW